MLIYLIGSLRNPRIPEIAQQIRENTGQEVFDDWFAAGPLADDSWRDYEKARGNSYEQGLQGWAAKHVFDFDFYHLNRSSTAVLVSPAGKSGHLEFGYMRGRGKPGFILLDPEVERWDVMYQFATGVCSNMEELIRSLNHGRSR